MPTKPDYTEKPSLPVVTFSDTTAPLELCSKNHWGTAGVPLVTTDGASCRGLLWYGSDQLDWHRLVCLDPATGGKAATLDLHDITGVSTTDTTSLLTGWGRVLAFANGPRIYVFDPDTSLATLAYTGSCPPLWMGTFQGALYVAWPQRVVRIADGTATVVLSLGSGHYLNGPPLLLDRFSKSTQRLEVTHTPVLVYADTDGKGNVSLATFAIGVDTAPVRRGDAWKGSAPFAPVFDGARVVLASTGSEHTIRAWDVADWSPSWDSIPSFNAAITTSIVPFENMLCCCTGAVLRFIEASDGRSLHKVELQAQVDGALRLIEGALMGISTAGVYSIDAAKRTVVELPLGGGVHWLGASSEVAYFGLGTEAYAASFTAVTRAFDADIQLMQDFRGPAEAVKRTSAWQFQLTLRDDTATARGDEELWVWTSVPATILLNGERKAAGVTAVRVRTDGLGRLRFSLEAEELLCPQVMISAPFMEFGEWVVVSPDSGLHEQLGSLSGADLRQGTDYAGNPILKVAVRGTTASDAIAEAVRRTMTLERDPRRSVEADRYLTPRLAGKGLFTTRRDEPRSVAMPLRTPDCWTLDLNESATFEVIDAATAAEIAAGAESFGLDKRSVEWWELLERGEVEVLKLTMKVGEGDWAAAHAVIDVRANGEKKTIDLVVETIRQAAILVQSLFWKVAESIIAVTEAFSAVLDWKNILATNTLIQDTLARGIVALRAPDKVAKLRAEAANAWQGLSAGLGATLAGAESTVGGTRLNDAAYAGDPEAEVPTPQAGTGGIQESWVADRILDELAMGLPGGANPLSGVLAGFASLFGELAQILEDDAGARIEESMTQLSRLTASQLLSGDLGALLACFAPLADLASSVFGAVRDAVSDAALGAIVAIWDVMQEEIDFPLLEGVLGRRLKWIDLITLPVAGVATFLAALLGPDRRRSADTLELVGAGFLIVNAILDTAIELSGWLVRAADQWKASEFTHIHYVKGYRVALGLFFTAAMAVFDFVDLFLESDPDTRILGAGMFMQMALSVGLDALIASQDSWLARDDTVGLVGGFGLGLMGWGQLISGVIANGSFQERFNIFASNAPIFTIQLLRPLRVPIDKVRNGAGSVLVAVVVGSLELSGAAAVIANERGLLFDTRRSSDALPGHRHEVRHLREPTSAPHFTPSPGAGSRRIEGLAYAVSFYDDAAETRRGPWSEAHALGAVESVRLSRVPIDPTGLARGRRIYRRTSTGEGVVLAGTLADNTSTEFVDTLG